jgi:hypothetical protein
MTILVGSQAMSHVVKERTMKSVMRMGELKSAAARNCRKS